MAKHPLPRVAPIPGQKRKPGEFTPVEIYNCEQKHKYKNPREAFAKNSRVYRCPICKTFHRTTKKINKKTFNVFGQPKN